MGLVTRGPRDRRPAAATALAAVVAAVVAGGLATLAPAAAPPAGAASRGAGVHAAKVPGRGTVLVDGAGRTLYTFSPDKHGAPTCSGTCASIWPPLTITGKPVAGKGITASLLGTVAGAGGTQQVTYDHWPLYTYVQDGAPGEATGQGIVSFGGTWSTIGPKGSPFARAAGTSHHPAGTGGTGGGSGY
jgi:predicted lipoprotein with Yx(FWY)xxD motif